MLVHSKTKERTWSVFLSHGNHGHSFRVPIVTLFSHALYIQVTKDMCAITVT